MSYKGVNQLEHQLLKEQPLKLAPFDEEFNERRTVSGLIIPTGIGDNVQKFILQKEVSGMVLGLWRKQLKARVFHLQGNMVFKANFETYKELPRSDENDFWERYDKIKGEGSS